MRIRHIAFVFCKICKLRAYEQKNSPQRILRAHPVPFPHDMKQAIRSILHANLTLGAVINANDQLSKANQLTSRLCPQAVPESVLWILNIQLVVETDCTTMEKLSV